MSAFKTINTSTPFWEMDAEAMAQENTPFEIFGINSQEQRRFILDFAIRHRWSVTCGDGTARLHPHGIPKEKPHET